MKSPSPELLELLTRAAELRAAGTCWEAVGRRLDRHPDTCRHWPAEFPDLWPQLLRAAQDAFRTEADAEARSILRGMLRSNDDKTRMAAAQKLLLPPPRSAAPADADAETLALDAELRELSDDDLDQLIRDFLEDDQKPAGSVDAPRPTIAQ
ncbi:MAG: hypothetical protein ACJ8F7_02515 [Gemmataceae bacterium]